MEEGLIELIIKSLWLVLPAYLPNSAAAVFGGGTPVDFNRKLKGKRILGDGKTWKGLLSGITAGILLGIALNQINGALSGILGISIPEIGFTAILTLSVGAMLGDMTASFFKRRLDKKRGSPVPLLDQLDFLLGALVLSLVFAPEWVSAIGLKGIAAVGILTPVVHVSTNMIGYKIGVKDEPW